MIDDLPVLDLMNALIERTRAAGPVVPSRRYTNTSELCGASSGARTKVMKAFRAGAFMAVKVLPVDDENLAGALHQVLMMEAAGAHPNIARLHGAFLTTESSLLVEIEFCQMNLAEFMERAHCYDTGMAEEQARLVMTQVLRALAHLHARSIVHADVKLQNILVKTTGATAHDRMATIKLCDFDAARFVPNGAHGGMIAPDYQANAEGFKGPETLLLRPFGCGVDIWALGCCFVHMLCGTATPFRWWSSTLCSVDETGAQTLVTAPPQEQLNLIDMLMGPLPRELFVRTPEMGILTHVVRPIQMRGGLPLPPTPAERFAFSFAMIKDERALELLRLMLEPVETRRISAAVALNDPWIIGERKNETPIGCSPVYDQRHVSVSLMNEINK